MRILMVLDKPYPPDIRVENEVDSLVSAGHDVAVLSIGPDDRPESETLENGVRILRRRTSQRWVHAMRALAATWPLSTRYVARAIVASHGVWKFDAVHVHDMYLAGAGLAAAARLGTPCVVDLHEHWSHVIREYRWSSGFPRRWIVGRRRWLAYERRWLPRADLVITVGAEMAADYAGLTDRLVTVPNYVRLDGYGALPVRAGHPGSVRQEPSVLYVGGLLPNRPLDDAVRGIRLVREAGLPVRLNIVGDGVEGPALRSMVRSLAMEDAVFFPGWVGQDEIPTWVANATVCIHLLRRSRQNDVASPHKLFQYMIAGRPLVVSDCPAMAEVVRTAECGLIVRDGDVRAFADAIISLVRDPDEADRLGRRGRQAVLDRYNWDAAVKPLLAWYASRDPGATR
jgi:glycosyltransferase involved in cell wall biosynthesis